MNELDVAVSDLRLGDLILDKSGNIWCLIEVKLKGSSVTLSAVFYNTNAPVVAWTPALWTHFRVMRP